MAKKPKDQEAAADFFGEDDLGWLDEPDDEVAVTDAPVRPAPVVPPPPPPFQATTRTATPIDGATLPAEPPVARERRSNESDWDPKVTDAPSSPNPLANAQTVILQIQRPPTPAPAKASPKPAPSRTPTGEHPRIVVPVPPPLEAQVSVDETPSRPPLSEPPPQPTAGAHVLAQVNVPGQPTPGPSVERHRISPARRAERARSPQPVPERKPPQPLPAFVPPEGDAGWREVVDALTAEAAAASGGAERATLLSSAGRVALERLRDAELASDRLRAALAADATRPADHLLYARVARALDWHEEEERALRAAADTSVGAERVRAALHAARLASRRGDVDAAVGHLRVAAAADPDDYQARLLLLELLPEREAEERLAVATDAARLADGAIAADHHVLRARIEETRDRSAQARAAYEAALEASPDHTEAFHGLEALTVEEPEVRARLYERRADRTGGTTIEAAWWWFEAGRAWAAAGHPDKAASAWTVAHAAGSPEAGPALEAASLDGASDTRGALLTRELASAAGPARAHLSWRLAVLRERAGNTEGALASYREVLALDPRAAPALDAVRRLLSDRPAEEAEVLAALAETSPLAALALAERAELDGDHAAARAAYTTASERAEGILQVVALDGLDRVLTHLGDTDALRAARLSRAAASDPAERSAWLLLAAHPLAPDEGEGALAPLRAGLEERPSDAALLAAITVPLERAGLWDELARRNRSAGGAPDVPARRGVALYRAARILRDRLARADEADALAEQAASADPHLHALWPTATDPDTAVARMQDRAARAPDPAERVWCHFAAGVSAPGLDARDDLELVLAEDPGHAGARRALEIVLAAEGDNAGLADLYATGATESSGVRRAWQACRAALLLLETGRSGEAVAMLERVEELVEQSDDGPLRIAAWLAVRLGENELATELLSGSEEDADQAERARLLTEAGRSHEAFPILLALTEEATTTGIDAVAIAAQAAAAARRGGDAAVAARLLGSVAAHATAPAVRAAYRSLAAEGTQPEPEPTTADPAAEAAALEATSPRAAPAERLADLVIATRLRELAGDWAQASADLAAWREFARDEQVRLTADVRRRWLTEKLASNATERGEDALSVTYLEELAASATDPAEATALRLRIAKLHETMGHAASARQAYLDALDHTPDAQDAVDGLRRVAVGEHDWPALVAVLHREAGTASRERAIEIHAEIASVTEDKIGDLPVAVDRWRSVIELDPRHEDALRHLVELSERLGEWGTFVEMGEMLAPLLPVSERGALLRKLGIACQDHLGREDATRFFEEAVAVGPPDLEAARRLEGQARTRGDWPQVVRALELQAAADADPDGRRSAWFRAARIQVETLEDRTAAAVSYRKILDLQPDDAQALRFVGHHLFEQGLTAEALEICERLDPVVERGQDLEDFDTRIELSGFYFMFAEMLVQRGDVEGALARYERALELNPTHLQSLEAVAPVYTDRKDWAKAERVYRQLLQLSGGQGDKQRVAATYTALGLVERELGATDKAYRRFGKALELHPHNVGALKGMALVLEDREDWSNVLNVYNNIIYHATLPADVIDAYMTKGRILDDHMQRTDKAAQHYQRSLDFDPDQPDAWLRLAELSLRRNAWAEAAEQTDRGLALASHVVEPFEARLHLVRAYALHGAGRTADAEASLRRALERDPRLADALGDRPLEHLDQLRLKVRELTAES